MLNRLIIQLRLVITVVVERLLPLSIVFINITCDSIIQLLLLFVVSTIAVEWGTSSNISSLVASEVLIIN
jgi:hypothetical protein